MQKIWKCSKTGKPASRDLQSRLFRPGDLKSLFLLTFGLQIRMSRSKHAIFLKKAAAHPGCFHGQFHGHKQVAH